MDRNWNRQELAEYWSLRFEELARTEAKSEPLRLGFAAQLKVLPGGRAVSGIGGGDSRCG